MNRSLKNIIREEIHKVLTDEVENFNKIIAPTTQSKTRLTESSINRMLYWLKNCDCAFITSFRSKLKDIRDKSLTYLGPNGDWDEDKEFTHEENREKNKIMVAELLQLGYGVTKIKGVYPEGMTKENSEESYFVVNRNNDDKFLDNILRISEKYNQDSVYYKEKGATEGHLIGTNNCDFPGYHKKGEGSSLKIGTASNYMSRLGNKAFSFTNNDAEKTIDKKDAMDKIEKSKGTDDEWKQRYWTDHDGTSFLDRKKMRKKLMSNENHNRLLQAVNFWRNITEGKMLISENIHPLTRKSMYEAISEYKRKMQNN